MNGTVDLHTLRVEVLQLKKKIAEYGAEEHALGVELLTQNQHIPINPAYFTFELNTSVCKDIVLKGNYAYCADKLRENSDCLVYSFGINDNWEFDNAMEIDGCKVEGFEPASQLNLIALQEKYNSRYKTLHMLGIGGVTQLYAPGTFPFKWPGIGYLKDTNQVPWQVYTLPDIIKKLEHTEKKISVIKLDAEGVEWQVLENLLSTDLLANGKLEQFILELHFNPDHFRAGNFWIGDYRSGHARTAEEINGKYTIESLYGNPDKKFIDILYKVRALGWVFFYIRVNWSCCLEIAMMKTKGY